MPTKNLIVVDGDTSTNSYKSQEAEMIISRAAKLIGGQINQAIKKAKVWFEYEPLTGFGDQTAKMLVEAGHADAVQEHLNMLEDGIFS